MESVKFWVALPIEQLIDLKKGKEVLPDRFSSCFWFRKCPAETVDRSQLPRALKNYAVMEMEVSALGYLQKVEGGVLEKTKPTEYRWHGPVRHEERGGQGRVLYRIGVVAAIGLCRHLESWYRDM